jgi:flagellar basal-body rod protein FlgF
MHACAAKWPVCITAHTQKRRSARRIAGTRRQLKPDLARALLTQGQVSSGCPVMNIASLIAGSRVVAQERAIEVTAMNIANVNTPGFQASRVQFAAWLNPQRNGAALPGEPQIAYTQDRATWRDQQQGSLSQTGNPFDLALRDGGYFTVNTARGPRLTRDGKFGPLPNGTIGDDTGNPLLDVTGQPIQMAQGDTQITIKADGTVSSQNGQLGKIGVVKPIDPMKLQAEGNSLLRADTPTSQAAVPGLVQGVLEGSNVPPVLELTTMMNGLRDYQFTTQLIQAEDDRIQSTIDKTLPTNS